MLGAEAVGAGQEAVLDLLEELRQPGDELRYVDWSVYGRLDKLFIKLFHAEKGQTAHILLDISRSMAGGNPSKDITAKKIAAAVKKTLQPDGINLLQCNGPAAGQTVLHFHMHVLPRRDGDDLKMNWGLQPGDMDAIGALAERIRQNL